MNDGGNAFPSRENDWRGMSLRDYFAAKVLPSSITRHWGDYSYMETIAAEAYEMADAMLAERAKAAK